MPDSNIAKPIGLEIEPDATSDETLHDLEENENESEAEGTSSDTAPSPDGSFEKDEGGRMKDETAHPLMSFV